MSRVFGVLALLLLALLLATLPANADDPADRPVMVARGDTIGPAALRVSDTGDVWAGMNAPITGQVNEFRWSANAGTLSAPRMIVGDHNDPPDLALRRSGDSGANGASVPLGGNVNIGALYWQPLPVDNTDFQSCGNPNAALGQYATLGCRRAAQIHARTVGTPTLTSTAGLMELSVTRVGETAVTLAMQIREPVTNETAIALWWQDGTVRRFQQVLVGPPDSAGTGFRSLRVAN